MNFPIVERSSSIQRLFIFDFDCTLSSHHVYWFLNNVSYFKKLYPHIDEVRIDTLHAKTATYLKTSDSALKDIALTAKDDFVELLFSGYSRIDNLRKMFDELITHGHMFCILSKGIVEQIIACLKFVGLDNAISYHDGTPQVFGHKMNKVTVLFDATCVCNVVYIDDDHTEHIKFIDEYCEHIDKDSIARKITELKQDENIIHYSVELTKHHHITTYNYIFMKSLLKDIGGGLNGDQMKMIPKIL